MRKIIFASIFVFLSIFVYSQNSVQKAINKLKYDSYLKNASLSILVVDLKSGEIIGSLNPQLSVKPASTLKLVTSAAALDLFGPNYKFKTEVGYIGKIDTVNRKLIGDLIIKGYGDPTLGSSYFESTDKLQYLRYWLAAIKKLGIDTIKGRLIADDSFFQYDVPATWTWEDIGNYYGAGPSGLTIHDNMYTIHFKTGSAVGSKTVITKINPLIPGMTFKNYVTAANIRSDKSYIYGTPYTYNRVIRGRLPRNKSDFKVKGAMPDPALYAAIELDSLLLGEGIIVAENITTVRILSKTIDYSHFQVVSTIYSPPLAQIIQKLNYKSINLFAEQLLVQIGKKLGDIENTEDAADLLENYWVSKGMDSDGVSFFDGCGLSAYNIINASQMLYVLDYMHDKSPNFDAYYQSLPVSGESGTLKYVCDNTPASGKIHAKSGSLKKVRCYAGYTTSASGRELGFAFLANNFNCSDRAMKQKWENLMVAMVLFNE